MKKRSRTHRRNNVIRHLSMALSEYLNFKTDTALSHVLIALVSMENAELPEDWERALDRNLRALRPAPKKGE